MQNPKPIPQETLRTQLKVLKGTKASQLSLLVREFLLDRKSRNLAPGTLRFYRQKLTIFTKFLAAYDVDDLEDIGTTHVRHFLVHLQETGHTAGGQHAYFRALRAFFKWAVAEEEVETAPTEKLKAPRVPEKVLEPVSMEDVHKMLAVCDTKTELGCRDQSVILALLDTGLRASEMVGLDLRDVDLATGTVIVRQSKGKRPRPAFLGAKTLKALMRYLRYRDSVADDAPLWTTRSGGRLAYTGLRDIIRRRAEDAGVDAPPLHAFRRSFALLSLRNGIDVYSLQRLMGHADLTVLRRYLAQTEADLKNAHERTGPVDNLL